MLHQSNIYSVVLYLSTTQPRKSIRFFLWFKISTREKYMIYYYFRPLSYSSINLSSFKKQNFKCINFRMVIFCQFKIFKESERWLYTQKWLFGGYNWRVNGRVQYVGRHEQITSRSIFYQSVVMLILSMSRSWSGSGGSHWFRNHGKYNLFMHSIKF